MKKNLDNLKNKSFGSQEEAVKNQIFSLIKSRNLSDIQELFGNLDKIHSRDSIAPESGEASK